MCPGWQLCIFLYVVVQPSVECKDSCCHWQAQVWACPRNAGKCPSLPQQILDTQQVPAARCAMGDDICMYQRTASSAVESMNWTNERVRDRTDVDPINSLILLIKLKAMWFEKHREKAWTCADELTPQGKKLARDAFQRVNVCDYHWNRNTGWHILLCGQSSNFIK